MKIIQVFGVLVCGLFCITQGWAQDQAAIIEKMNKDLIKNETVMKTYVIEREIPDAGKLTAEQLRGISQKSNTVVAEMGPGIQWVHSYVTENKVYCVYKAENEETIKKHAEKGGFPADRISELSTMIDPDTGGD
ncbi:MAG TPA: DUF4242 domain-containing protein [Eudoraea sp.]|nr:DUF4242 domain-containing protein [Eudoraea sp.]